MVEIRWLERDVVRVAGITTPDDVGEIDFVKERVLQYRTCEPWLNFPTMESCASGWSDWKDVPVVREGDDV